MSAEEMVDATLVGFDQRVTIIAFRDPDVDSASPA
jgi:hypothetical protein